MHSRYCSHFIGWQSRVNFQFWQSGNRACGDCYRWWTWSAFDACAWIKFSRDHFITYGSIKRTIFCSLGFSLKTSPNCPCSHSLQIRDSNHTHSLTSSQLGPITLFFFFLLFHAPIPSYYSYHNSQFQPTTLCESFVELMDWVCAGDLTTNSLK